MWQHLEDVIKSRVSKNIHRARQTDKCLSKHVGKVHWYGCRFHSVPNIYTALELWYSIKEQPPQLSAHLYTESSCLLKLHIRVKQDFLSTSTEIPHCNPFTTEEDTARVRDFQVVLSPLWLSLYRSGFGQTLCVPIPVLRGGAGGKTTEQVCRPTDPPCGLLEPGFHLSSGLYNKWFERSTCWPLRFPGITVRLGLVPNDPYGWARALSRFTVTLGDGYRPPWGKD